MTTLAAAAVVYQCFTQSGWMVGYDQLGWKHSSLAGSVLGFRGRGQVEAPCITGVQCMKRKERVAMRY